MKKVAYDEYYLQENYFGNPYPGLVAFFKAYSPKGKILDLGCGQGRDSLFLARLGYEVIGVDHSKVGITQMLERARIEGLKLNALVADVYSYEIDHSIDMVLLDSMLHFNSKDMQKEIAFVKRILDKIKLEGIFVNLIIKGDKREAALKRIIVEHPDRWQTLHEGYVDYPEVKCSYHMLVVKKTS